MEYTSPHNADDVSEEITDIAIGIVEGWYPDGRIEWSDVIDRMDGSVLEDGTTLHMGEQSSTPAIRKIKRAVRAHMKLPS